MEIRGGNKHTVSRIQGRAVLKTGISSLGLQFLTQTSVGPFGQGLRPGKMLTVMNSVLQDSVFLAVCGCCNHVD